jgi:hypothetical protein
MSESKIGSITVLKTGDRQEAHYQLMDGSLTFLCALALDDYENPVLREQFFALATEVVAERIRASGGNVQFAQRDTAPAAEANPHARVPCWACTSPIAADVRSLLRSSAASDIHLSPSGLPMTCCRVTAVGSFGTVSEPAHARR